MSEHPLAGSKKRCVGHLDPLEVEPATWGSSLVKRVMRPSVRSRSAQVEELPVLRWPTGPPHNVVAQISQQGQAFEARLFGCFSNDSCLSRLAGCYRPRRYLEAGPEERFSVIGVDERSDEARAYGMLDVGDDLLVRAVTGLTHRHATYSESPELRPTACLALAT